MTETDLKPFYSINIPTVVLDCEIRGSQFDTVTIHNEDGIWRGMKYLYESGHKNIGYFRSSFSIRNFDQRFFAYKDFLEQFNINPDEQKIYMLEPSITGAYNDICELIGQNLEFPPAIMADNDLIALGAIKAFEHFGIKIPEDISIVGFDDIPMSSVIDPKLTSVRVPCDELGAAAVNRLIWRKENTSAFPTRLAVGTKLKIRSSVKPVI